MVIEIIVYILMLYFAPIPWVVIFTHLMVIKNKLTSLLIPFIIYLALCLIIGYFTYPYIQVIFSWKFNNIILKLIGLVILVLAFIITWQSAKSLSFSRIFGSSEIKKTKEKLITTGIYKFARHPRHVVYPLWFLGFGLLLGYFSLLLFSVYLFLSLVITSYIEEIELIRRYGIQYLKYKKTTPAFFIRLK